MSETIKSLQDTIEALTQAANDYTAAITELARLGVSHWKLIETAPTDGTHILVWGPAWDDGFFAIVHWNGTRWEGEAPRPEYLTPTYWMSLRKPAH